MRSSKREPGEFLAKEMCGARLVYAFLPSAPMFAFVKTGNPWKFSSRKCMGLYAPLAILMFVCRFDKTENPEKFSRRNAFSKFTNWSSLLIGSPEKNDCVVDCVLNSMKLRKKNIV